MSLSGLCVPLLTKPKRPAHESRVRVSSKTYGFYSIMFEFGGGYRYQIAKHACRHVQAISVIDVRGSLTYGNLTSHDTLRILVL